MQRWPTILGISCTLLILFLQIPQLMHMADTRYLGIPIHLSSDEYNYLPRVQEALSGRPELAAEAVVGDASLVPMQSALIEKIEGTLFGWTGWRASTVFQIMDAVVPPLIFVGIWWFLFVCGFTRWQSFGGAVLFTVLNLYNLNRPIHQRTSFLLELAALLGVIRGVQGYSTWGLIGGVLMGLLVGVYFWSWTFVWVWWGILLLYEVWESLRYGYRKEVEIVLLMGLIGGLIALPSVTELITLTGHPLYGEAQYRSGILFSRTPQSWMRSLLFLGMAVGVFGSSIMYPKRLYRYRFAIITILTACIALNQQVIHGVILFFSSHYLISLIFGGVVCLTLSCVVRNRWTLLSGVCAFVFLAGIAYDGRHIIKQFILKDDHFYEQHLASMLPVLDAMPRIRILSDQQTSLFIAGHTYHDTVYSIYLKNVLISDEEFAERYCLTLLPIPPNERHIEDSTHLLYFEQRQRSQDVRDREVQMVKYACSRMDKDPNGFLKKYGVDYLFWNEKSNPSWNVTKLKKVRLEKIETGNGWPAHPFDGAQAKLGSEERSAGWSLWRILS